MPIQRVQELPYLILDIVQSVQRRIAITPIWLGGGSGAGGGAGQRPGGFLGKLIQSLVAYDETEGNSISTGSSPALLDNLNHIRAYLSPQVHGVARWRALTGESTFALPDLAEQVDYVSVAGSIQDPGSYTLADNRDNLVLGSALGSDSVVSAGYVVLRL